MLWLGQEECNVTWEKAEDLPSQVIREFEQGDKAVVSDYTMSKMGQTVHTLAVDQRQRQPETTNHPRPVIQSNTGCVQSA